MADELITRDDNNSRHDLSLLRPCPLVELTTPDLLSSSDKKSLYDIVIGMYLLSLHGDNKSPQRIQRATDLLTHADINDKVLKYFGQILYEDSLRELTQHAIQYEAITRKTVETNLNQEWRTIYRNLNTLNKLGILIPYLPPNHERGRSVTIYHTPHIDPEVLQNAIQTDKKLRNPLYQKAVTQTQLILELYPHIKSTKEGITRPQLNDFMAKAGINGRAQTIDLVCTNLRELGVTVWR